jgi:hypothetical protein
VEKYVAMAGWDVYRNHMRTGTQHTEYLWKRSGAIYYLFDRYLATYLTEGSVVTRLAAEINSNDSLGLGGNFSLNILRVDQERRIQHICTTVRDVSIAKSYEHKRAGKERTRAEQQLL